jgi:chromosome segregation ATPase
VTHSSPPVVTDPHSEVLALRQALQIRDRLIQQLSEELFRLLVQPGGAVSPAQPQALLPAAVGEEPLQHQLQAVETQLHAYQAQVAERDAEVDRLTQELQELRERNSGLTQTVQELPEVYRQKFANRLLQVQQTVKLLQQENQQLRAELQTVSYQLALLSRDDNPPATNALRAADPLDSFLDQA